MSAPEPVPTSDSILRTRKAARDSFTRFDGDLRAIQSPRARFAARQAATQAIIDQAFNDHLSLSASSPDKPRIQQHIVDSAKRLHESESEFLATVDDEEQAYEQQRESILETFCHNMVMALGLESVRKTIRKIDGERLPEIHTRHTQVRSQNRAEPNHEPTPPATENESVDGEFPNDAATRQVDNAPKGTVASRVSSVPPHMQCFP